MIETPEQLQEWIAEHPKRHRKVGAAAKCSCGWVSPQGVDVSWDEHESVMLISDLGDVLPSDSYGPGLRPKSWREVCDELYEIIDSADEVVE